MNPNIPKALKHDPKPLQFAWEYENKIDSLTKELEMERREFEARIIQLTDRLSGMEASYAKLGLERARLVEKIEEMHIFTAGDRGNPEKDRDTICANLENFKCFDCGDNITPYCLNCAREGWLSPEKAGRLRAVLIDFVAKVESGRAKSTDTYNKAKLALEETAQ